MVIRNSVDTSFSIKKYKSDWTFSWSNSESRMGTGSTTTVVKWYLWIRGVWSRDFHCRCYDVDFDTGIVLATCVGPFWMEPSCVVRICHRAL